MPLCWCRLLPSSGGVAHVINGLNILYTWIEFFEQGLIIPRAWIDGTLEYDDGTRKSEKPAWILLILQYMGTLKHTSNMHGCPRQQDATPPPRSTP
jgi:hypothetical protein